MKATETKSKPAAKAVKTKTAAATATKSKPAPKVATSENIAATAKKTTTAKAPTTTKTETPAAAKMVKPKKDAAEGLRDLFVDGLKDIYWAEKALTKALPKMAKNATTPQLKNAFKKHLTETEGQITRLENVFKTIGEKAVAKKCDAMEGLLKEADGIMEETEPGVVRDAGIIAAAQKVEHYEIATYGTLHAFAITLGETEAAEYLAFTLEQEKNADSKLTDIALSTININAAEN
jgi:ferritin-like metal-binding protein YciE